MRRRAVRGGAIAAVFAAASILGTLLVGCSVVRGAATWNDPARPVAGSGANGAAPAPTDPSAAAAAVAPAYDVTPLLRPSRKYLGVEVGDAPGSMAPVDRFASLVGERPDLIGQFVAWNTSFDSQAASHAWSYGAIDFVVWEPTGTSLAQIADGASDAYLTRFATAVRTLNVPIALSFGHEFNGNWYPWGTTHATAAQFVAAWQHVHNLFAAAGATNVIWIWDPNDIYPVQDVRLEPYYPGDAYVDWVGVSGYWTQQGPNDYASLYLPTLEEVRTFTRKPFLVAETAVEPGSNESSSLTNLLDAVEQHPDIIGFVWFDYDEGADWRIENRPSLAGQFKDELATGGFGFNVRALK